MLVVAVPLQHPAPNAELSLVTHASDTQIGGVMQQKSGDHWRTLGFFSRKLTDTELLAVHVAIKHFCNFCEGRAFQLWTNHLLLPFPALQHPFRPDNNAIWRSSQNLTCSCCICPVLIMSLQIFCPAQTKQPLDQSPPHRRRIQWISKRWPPRKTAARKRSACWAAYRSNWLSARQALNTCLEMFLQAILFSSNCSP
jgi:hypothetical protein